MSQLALAGDVVGPEPDPEQSQWFTPPRLAIELVNLSRPLLLDSMRRDYSLRVLEPSAGSGNLIRALLEIAPSARVSAVEIDPRWHRELAAIARTVTVIAGDYLVQPPPAQLYDIAITNPPFDGGDETPHVAKMLDESRRINALLPARSFHGAERYEQIWKRFDPQNPKRDWWLHAKVHCCSRPKFGAKGGSDEIVLIDARNYPGECAMRWL